MLTEKQKQQLRVYIEKQGGRASLMSQIAEMTDEQVITLLETKVPELLSLAEQNKQMTEQAIANQQAYLDIINQEITILS